MLWNSLEENTRNLNTVNAFKNALTPKRTTFPFQNLSKNRKMTITHARLRHQCSTLNYDLFRCNLIDDPKCGCGNPCENAFHYFFECLNYTHSREDLLNALRPITEINLDIILFGNELVTPDENMIIFQAVHQYIQATHRF